MCTLHTHTSQLQGGHQSNNVLPIKCYRAAAASEQRRTNRGGTEPRQRQLIPIFRLQRAEKCDDRRRPDRVSALQGRATGRQGGEYTLHYAQLLRLFVLILFKQ